MRGPNLSEWALRNQQLILFMMVLFAVAGLYAYQHLGRKEDPEFTFKSMLVQAYWPGASAREMSEQVTDKLEKKLQEIAEIDYTRSYSRSGEAQITISLLESVQAPQVPDVWYQVRKKIEDMRPQLPSDLQGPYFNDEFGDTFGNIYALTWDGFSYAEAKNFAEAARYEFLQLPDVMKVNLVGEQDEKIFVEASGAKLASLGVDPSAIVATLSSTNSIDSAGTVENTAERVNVRITGAFTSLDSIRAIGIRAGDRTFRLGDIATVRRGYQDPPTMQMRFKGKEAIGIAVSMRKGGDVIRLGKQMTQTVAKLQREFPVGIAIGAVSDQPKVVQDSIGEFVHSLGEAVIIVLAVSFIALGMRVGFVVALSIPLVLAMTFLAMYMLDIDLQRVSLGALIIALGLLVDDAIIAVEMMALKLEQGWDRLRAATYAYTSTAFPMLTGTLITAASFLPIGMAKTNAGEYTFSIFQVVGISLLLSWIVAVIFTPYIAFKLLPRNGDIHHFDDAVNEPATDAGEMMNVPISHEDAVYQRPVYARFRRLVDWCVAHRLAVVATTIGLFVLSIALFRLVPQQFFPESDRPELMVDLWLPQGASYAATEREVKAMEQALAGNEDIISVTSYVGVGSPRFYLPLDQQTPNINFGQLVVMTHGEESRERVLARIRDLFEHDFPLVRGRVTRLENGPPVGYPVQFRVSGPDDRKVAGIADQLANLMRANPNIRRVNSDAGEQVKVMRAEIDQDKVRMLGLSTREVARMMQIGFSGLVTTQFREGDEAIEVVARLEQAERTDLGNLKDAKLYLSDGRSVALSQVARLSLDAEDSILWRRNRVPTITVRADVEGAQGNDVTAALQPSIAELSKSLPLGYAIVVAGSSEASANSSAAIMAVVPVALVVILVLLMIQLRDMKKTALVLATGPLGLIGVTAILGIFRVPFGFVAMLGVIALFGMILRNSVILITQIDSDLSRGCSLREAIVESAVRRLRPISLTALAAILAMIPLTRSTFWGPMAWAIMGGLLVATLLTLLFLPALYALCYGVSRPQPRSRPRRRLLPLALLACAAAPSAGALDLIEAHRAAREHDAEFAAQLSAADAGREYAVQGRAALLPRVNISGSANRRNQEVRQSGDLSSLLNSDANGDVYGYSVSISQPLYRPDAMADKRSLTAQSEIAALSLRAAEQDLILRVAQTYFSVLLAQDALEFAKAQRAAVAEQLSAAKERFDSGRARVTDVAEAQANFDALAAAEIAAQSDLEVARARFYALTGRDGEDPDPIAAGKLPASTEELREWLNRARANSLEIRIRDRESAIADSEVKRASLAGRLSVDIVARLDDQHQDGELSPLAYPDQSTAKSIGLQFSMPVFAGGALQSKYRQAVAQSNQARQQLEATRREVEVDVREAHTQVTSGAMRVTALEQGLVSAQTSLEAGELGREVGNRTNLDVLNLQQQVFDVKRDLSDARYGYLLTRLKLAALAGELTENDLTTLIRR